MTVSKSTACVDGSPCKDGKCGDDSVCGKGSNKGQLFKIDWAMISRFKPGYLPTDPGYIECAGSASGRGSAHMDPSKAGKVCGCPDGAQCRRLLPASSERRFPCDAPYALWRNAPSTQRVPGNAWRGWKLGAQPAVPREGWRQTLERCPTNSSWCGDESSGSPAWWWRR